MKAHATRRFAVCLIAALALLSHFPDASAADPINLRSEHVADVPVVLTGPKATPLEQLAAREVRRYVYLRTGTLLPIAASSSSATAIVLKTDPALARQQYRLTTEGPVLTISGGSDAGVLYGAYAFAEKLGVRLQIDGDVIPDARVPLGLPVLDETHQPLFDLRGLQPFHDFPEGPDWWTLDDWEAVVSQAAKMRMNFIGLHTYPFQNKDLGQEPTVWVGLPEDVNADGTVRCSDVTTWSLRMS